MRMRNKIKVLFVGPLPPPIHGVSVLQKNLVESDLRNRFDAHVLDIADRSADAEKSMGRFTLGNVLNGISNCWRLFWKMRASRPRVVFLFLSQNRWGFFRDAIFIRIARMFGAKVVANLNGGLFRIFYDSCPAGRRRRIKRILGKISRIEVVGNKLRKLFEGLVPDECIVVTPNGIPIGFYEPVALERRRRPVGKNILYMGGLAPSKGVVDLIKAFTKLAERDSEAKLKLAGAWFKRENKELILETYENSAAKERIELLGVVSGQEKLDTFARADVFAMPTWYPAEGQPVAILEAMASGMPVVSCDRAAVVDMVVDGEGGFIVPPKDPATLTSVLEKLLGDTELARRQGEFNAARARELFSMERHIDKVEEDIRSAASG